MAFSPFDKRLLEEGLDFFAQPRLASLLEMLGATRFERLEALTTMLSNSSPEEFDETAELFERALARRARQQERAEQARRRPTAAERREQRRRSA